MTHPEPTPPSPLDYHKSERKPESMGCLVGAGVVGVLAALLTIYLLWAMLTSQSYGYAAAVAGGTTLVVLGAVVVNKRFGMSIALAVTLASICVGLLLMGLCTGAVLHDGL